MKRKSEIFEKDFFLIGLLSAILILLLNQSFPIVANMASILSPSGGKLTTDSGFHFKHWITGFILIGISTLMFTAKKSPRFSSALLGFGTLLVVDEVDDIYSFVMTGSL